MLLAAKVPGQRVSFARTQAGEYEIHNPTPSPSKKVRRIMHQLNPMVTRNKPAQYTIRPISRSKTVGKGSPYYRVLLGRGHAYFLERRTREVRRICQLVEKGGIELTTVTNPAQDARKPACLVPDPG